MKMNPVIFREYDIRGVYDHDFDLEFANLLGRAFVAYVIKKTGVLAPRLTLGHDARISSPLVAMALAEGLRASGAHVIHLGMITSPISYFSTFTLDSVHGGIMVTGSHNPPDHNGFKISFGKSTIFGDEIKLLETIIRSKEFIMGRGSGERIDILSPSGQICSIYFRRVSAKRPVP